QDDNVQRDCVTLIVLPADVRRIHIDQCEPYQVVILSQRRRICAQGDESTAKPDSSFHLALSLDEWGRMTKSPQRDKISWVILRPFGE
ncbi:MAG TPA: hypothetical protein PKM72_14750, partial [Nitrospirales bacterium]|nr:hypothetical protein [Nitrospirales bacterium]